LVEITMTYLKLQRKDKVQKYVKEIQERVVQKKVQDTCYL
jgi:hypothetical protein